MTPEKTERFIAWIDNKLSEARLTDSELAKRARMSHSVLSKARKGILPKHEACDKIAHALRVPQVEVYQAAGLIPTPQDLDTDFEQLKNLYGLLPISKRKLVVRFANMLVEEDPS